VYRAFYVRFKHGLLFLKDYEWKKNYYSTLIIHWAPTDHL
jgi:hypothetical protein